MAKKKKDTDSDSDMYISITGSAVALLKAGTLLQQCADRHITELKEHFYTKNAEDVDLDEFSDEVVKDFRIKLGSLKEEVESYAISQLASLADYQNGNLVVKSKKK